MTSRSRIVTGWIGFVTVPLVGLLIYRQYCDFEFDSAKWKSPGATNSDIGRRMSDDLRTKMLRDHWTAEVVYDRLGRDSSTPETSTDFRNRVVDRHGRAVAYNLGDNSGMWWIYLLFDEKGRVGNVEILPE